MRHLSTVNWHVHVPTAKTLAALPAGDRPAQIVDAIAAAREYLAELEELKLATAVELNAVHGLPWKAVAHLFREKLTALHNQVGRYRARRSRSRPRARPGGCDTAAGAAA